MATEVNSTAKVSLGQQHDGIHRFKVGVHFFNGSFVFTESAAFEARFFCQTGYRRLTDAVLAIPSDRPKIASCRA
jgi:hypothetical protein